MKEAIPMITNIYTVYDAVAESYLDPFFMLSDGQAIRALGDILLNPEHPFSQHPADYTLFRIGEYDNLRGRVVDMPTHVALGNLIEFKHEAPTISHAAPILRGAESDDPEVEL